VDLTSLNGSLKTNIPGKRPLDRPDKASSSSTGIRQQSPAIDEDHSATPDAFVAQEHDLGPAPNSVQVLDFHSDNPIISYQNELYSCTWSDMVGTNIFFARAPSQLSEPDESVDILGTSRIRLIGHRAKVAVKAGASSEAGRGLRANTISDPKAGFIINNPAFKRQADFLERLKGVKRAKGDTDVVREVIPETVSRTSPIPDRSSAVEEEQ
jgi:hypothetical protein